MTALAQILKTNKEVYTYCLLYSMHSLGSSELGDLNVFLAKLKGACDLFPDEIKELRKSEISWKVAHDPRIENNQQLKDHILTFHTYWKNSMENFDTHKQEALDPDNLSHHNLWELVDNFRYLLHFVEEAKDCEMELIEAIKTAEKECQEEEEK